MDFKNPEISTTDRLEIQEVLKANLPLKPAKHFWEMDSKISWLLPDIIPEGSLCVLYGRPKSGKSIWALNLAIAMGNMGHFLGRKCSGGRVGLIQLEDPVKLVTNRVKTMSTFPPETLFLSVGHPWGKEEREQLTFYIEALSLQLMIVDPLVLWRPGLNENSVEEMSVLMYDLRQVVMLTGCTVLVIHHSRKGGGDHGDSMRGSSAILGSCDAAIELRSRDDGMADMQLISRLSSVEDEVLEMDLEALLWYSLGPAGGFKVKQRREDAFRLLKSSGPLSLNEVKSELGTDKATTWRTLDYLVKEGRIASRTVKPEGKRSRNVYEVTSDVVSFSPPLGVG